MCVVFSYPQLSHIRKKEREKEKALFGGPLGVLRPLAEASRSAKVDNVGLSLDREKAWRYIWRTVPGSTAVGANQHR